MTSLFVILFVEDLLYLVIVIILIVIIKIIKVIIIRILLLVIRKILECNITVLKLDRVRSLCLYQHRIQDIPALRSLTLERNDNALLIGALQAASATAPKRGYNK